MRHLWQYGYVFPIPSLRYTTTLLFFAYAVFLPAGVLHAQDAVSANGQGAAAPGMNSQSRGAAAEPAAGFNETPPDVDGGPPKGSSSGSAPWSHLLLEAFQLGMRPGNHSVLSGGSHGFNGSGSGSCGGVTSQSGVGPGRPGVGRNSFGLNSILGTAGNLSRDLGAGKIGTLGTALGALPAFNQLMRGGLNLPINPSFGSLRLSYQDLFSGAGGAIGSRIGNSSPSPSFAGPRRVVWVDFSAAAAFSRRSMAGGSSTSAGMSSFGGQAGASTGGPSADSSMSGQTGGGPGGQGGGPGGPGGNNGGGKRPATSLSLHLSF
ncbi:MAG: hypothetical protein ABR923_22385 [Terracidiphilus sp.]|jgi:hypothetical protein